MTKEDLFAYICYNPYKFTETELAIFKNEIKARGLDDELSEKIKSKEADDIEFKNNVLNSSGDVTELLQNFNAFIEGKNPEIAKRVQEENAKKKKAITRHRVDCGSYCYDDRRRTYSCCRRTHRIHWCDRYRNCPYCKRHHIIHQSLIATSIRVMSRNEHRV
jgi:hypothetical protein